MECDGMPPKGDPMSPCDCCQNSPPPGIHQGSPSRDPQPTGLGMSFGLDPSNTPAQRRTASEPQSTFWYRKAIFFHTDLSEEEAQV